MPVQCPDANAPMVTPVNPPAVSVDRKRVSREPRVVNSAPPVE